MRAAGRVGAHQDLRVRVLAHRLGQLVEGIDQHADVIGGRVGAGVAGPKDAGQGLAAQVAEHRVEAVAALVGGGGALLVRVGRHERGVDVEDDLARARPGRPGALSGSGAGDPDGLEALRVDGVDHAPGGRVRGHPAEEIDLVAKRPEIRQAVAAVGEHHRQVAHHAPGIVGRGTLAGRRHRHAKAVCQPEPVGQLGEQNAPGARGHRRVIREHL